LGHYLKIWGDKWPCTGEVKGSTVPLMHTAIIITSNYTPEELWPDDDELLKAIRRRFKVEHILGRMELAPLADQPNKKIKLIEGQ
jgi:hypothetical protein